MAYYSYPSTIYGESVSVTFGKYSFNYVLYSNSFEYVFASWGYGSTKWCRKTYRKIQRYPLEVLPIPMTTMFTNNQQFRIHSL